MKSAQLDAALPGNGPAHVDNPARDGRSSRPRSRRKSRARGTLSSLLGIAGIATFLVIWQVLPSLGIISPNALPPFSAVFVQLLREFTTADFWVAVLDTMTVWMLGLLIAVTLGVVLGFVVGASSFLRKATYSTVEFLRPIPSVALIPLAILLFGVGIESTLMLVVIASFWPVFIQMLYGVADVDSVADNTARSFRIVGLSRIRFLVLPTALPYLMTGIRLSAAVALILAITGGLVIGSPGLGSEVARAQAAGANERLYALVLMTGVLGVIINLVMRQIERAVLGWHQSVRSEIVV